MSIAKSVSLLSCFFIGLLSACSYQNKPTNQDTVISKPTAPAQSLPPQPTIACREVVYQIVTTSDRFKELTKGLYDAVVKNGGTSYGIDLEGSPNPDKDTAMDYSKTYDYALHETYHDRNVVTARFTFNTTTKQLYEYDAAEDSLKPISFNKSLLLQLDSACK